MEPRLVVLMAMVPKVTGAARRNTACLRHQDGDGDPASIGVRPENDGHEISQGAVQAGDLVPGEGVVSFGAFVPEQWPLARDRRLRLVTDLGSVARKGKLVRAEVVIGH